MILQILPRNSSKKRMQKRESSDALKNTFFCAKHEMAEVLSIFDEEKRWMPAAVVRLVLLNL